MPAPDVLFGKAEEDLRAVHLLGADGSFGETIGFHCQQAIEKALKAVLEGAGVAAPKPHDLVGLIELLSAHDIDVPTASAARTVVVRLGRAGPVRAGR